LANQRIVKKKKKKIIPDFMKLKNLEWCKGIRVPVTHICNLTYSDGRDQEDHGLKTAWANSSQDPILKITITHIQRLVEWLKV
jgi:hypothetical protein